VKRNRELLDKLEAYVPLLTLGKIEYNEDMRRFLLIILYTSYFILFLSTRHVSAMWDCKQTRVDPVPAPLVYRCVEDPVATQYRTLRECLRCEDPATKLERPDSTAGTTCTVPPGADNPCKDDPRYIMRNFAALNFWSIGRGLSLAVPLVIVGGGLLCLVFMLYGAFTYVMSGGEEKKITDAMHMMTYAGLGLVVIVIGYAVVRTILFITKINTFGF
jgi:hypothetical protein